MQAGDHRSPLHIDMKMQAGDHRVSSSYKNYVIFNYSGEPI
ncbi:MAG: hypothetical protein R3Y53_08895 [Bacillota bacterium]